MGDVADGLHQFSAPHRSHNSGTVTYDDPRTVCPDAQNLEAEKVAQKVLATVQEDDEDADPDGASFSLPPISSDQPLRVRASG